MKPPTLVTLVLLVNLTYILIHSSLSLSLSLLLQYAQSELCPSVEQRVELIVGSGVYVTLARLEEARREAKNGTQLARKLMDAFWDRDTLARSSLSSKSKFQYQQLDPNVINTIEGNIFWCGEDAMLKLDQMQCNNVCLQYCAVQFIKYVLVHIFTYILAVVMKYVNVVSFHHRGVSKFD